jgi:hypothetical protein
LHLILDIFSHTNRLKYQKKDIIRHKNICRYCIVLDLFHCWLDAPPLQKKTPLITLPSTCIQILFTDLVSVSMQLL